MKSFLIRLNISVIANPVLKLWQSRINIYILNTMLQPALALFVLHRFSLGSFSQKSLDLILFNPSLI